MTSAVILILREVLEAMLIVSLLLAASSNFALSRRWFGVAILVGLAGATVYAGAFDLITDSFQGVGQEIVNAVTLFGICLCLALFGLFVVSNLRVRGSGMPQLTGVISLVGAIALAITREGAEIYIYLSGHMLSPEPMLPILIGGILGAGIGFSAGALIYYGLKALPPRRSLILICGLLVPVGAGLVSQGANYLMQADLLPSQLPIWDSSAIVREGSAIGELLYALFSYEATPTPLQVGLYLATALVMVAGMLLIFRHHDAGDEAHYA